MFYTQTEIRFACTSCGRCCLGHADENIIELVEGEIEKISAYLRIEQADFIKKYGAEQDNLDIGITINRQGCCVFLKENNHCAIYKVRPHQCRTYPYWPEIMASESAWFAEADRCEGINVGDVVSIAHIEKQLVVFDDN